MTNPQVALVSKSTRHQAIVGRFGEYLVYNWLSRSGFEVTLVDHTGIDVIAFDPRSGKRLGITVKSRTRNAGAERENITIFREKNQDRAKVSEPFRFKPHDNRAKNVGDVDFIVLEFRTHEALETLVVDSHAALAGDVAKDWPEPRQPCFKAVRLVRSNRRKRCVVDREVDGSQYFR